MDRTFCPTLNRFFGLFQTGFGCPIRRSNCHFDPVKIAPRCSQCSSYNLISKTSEPWFSGYRRRLIIRRLLVQIPAPDNGWTCFHIEFFCKICIISIKKTENKQKGGQEFLAKLQHKLRQQIFVVQIEK